MKRIICALLTVVMLAAMIPAFAVTSSAEEAVSYEPVTVTAVESFGDTIANSALLFTRDPAQRVGGGRVTQETGIIGTFAEPVTVSKLEICNQHYNSRIAGIKFYFLNATTGEWDLLYTVATNDFTTATGQTKTFELNGGDNLYTKVKMVQEKVNNYFDVKYITVYTAVAGKLTGKLNVTHVSASQNVCTLDDFKCGHTQQEHDEKAFVNWDKIWDVTNTTRLGYQFDETIEIIGKFDKPTEVTNVVINSVYWHNRMDNITISVSNDMQTWVELKKLPNPGTSGSYWQYNYTLDCAGVEYEYVKIEQKTANSDNKYCVDVRWIAFYNNLGNIDTVDNIQHVNQYYQPQSDRDASVFWDYSNNTQVQWAADPGTIAVTGEFLTPTVVDYIVLKLPSGGGARQADAEIHLSADGVKWDTFRTGTLSNSDAYCIFSISNNKEYKFIRLKKNTKWTFGLLSIGVVGTPTAPEANTTEADFYGVQTKVDAENWALRLISTVDSLDFKAVGYEIKVTGLDKDGAAVEKSFDEYTQTVYSSVIDNMGTRNAKALGGNYIFTATINGISIEKYAALTFEIKPYVADEKGQKTYGETQTYTFEDGVQK